jgi:nicotinamidase-related amidase
VWRVSYEDRALEAEAWAARHGLDPAAKDSFRVCLLAVDVQNTFCIPDFELFVAGRSGTGAVDDNRRLCEFVYRNLGTITQIFPSLDTHRAMQVFHAIWLIDERGEHPPPYTLVSAAEVATGRWRMNPAVAEALGIDPGYAERQLGGRQVRADHLALPRHARGDRVRPRLGGRGGGLLPRDRPA